MGHFLTFFLAWLILFSFVKPILAQDLIFNEIMSSNQQYLFDSDNATPDWFELYNSADSTINLADYSISDRNKIENAWTFPTYNLSSGEYIMVFASGKDRKEYPLYWSTIITEGDIWRYLVPVSEPPSTWNDATFNDDTWHEGSSGFGYGDNDDNTILNNAKSIFIRKTFSITTVSEVKEAILHIDYDDAFVAYLNGTEIARGNITSNGAPAFDAFADNYDHEARMYSGGLPEAFEINNIQLLLNNGNNVLAIQVHNATANSSDLTVIPFLSFGFTKPSEGTLAPFVEVAQKKFHTDFSISASGESLYLFKNSVLTDSVQVPELPTNISYGRNAQSEETWYYFNEPTPEKNNHTKAFSFLAGDVIFSVPGGIYNYQFELSLSSKNVSDKIYYTTNNTEPTPNDHLYTSPIQITSTTMVRASVINPNGIPGFVSTQSYFFGIKHDVPVVSLVTDPDNLFSYDKGIYVNGAPKPSSGENCDNGANYWQDWEVPIHVSLIEPSGRLAFEQNAGVKIFGGCSRNNPQKSLSLRFRKRYGKDGLHYKVFDDLDIDTFYSLNLRSSGNDWNGTMFRDGLQTHLFPASIDKTAFRPSVVYINGEYWGIHNIRERIDQDYLATHHQLDPNSVNLMEFHVNWLVNLVEGEDEHYLDLLDYIEQNDLSIQANYDYICSQMNVENFALYQAANICIKNTDWPGNNVKFWQSTEHDMKWRWITFDTDFGFTDANHNTLTFALADYGTSWPNPAISTFLLRQLNKNKNFQYLFINAFADELNTLWNRDELYALIDKMKGAIASEIPRHFTRWGANSSYWEGNVNSLYYFASQRPAVVRNFIKSYYNINGTYNLTLNVSDFNMGNIKINTIQPDKFPWTGIYFNNIPITLTALPKKGYHFVRWEGNIESSESTIEIIRNQATSLKAIFEKEEIETNIIINEIFYNNLVGETPNDWIELYNRGSATVDISGWKLSDAEDDHKFIIGENTKIERNDYFILCKEKEQFSSFYGLNTSITGDFDFGLSAESDCVRLFDKNDFLIDSLAYINTEPDSTIAFTYQRFLDHYTPIWYNIKGIGTPLAENSQGVSSDEIKLNAHLSEVIVYPNPFDEKMTIQFNMRNPGFATIKLLSPNGTIVWCKNSSYFEPGQQICVLENSTKLTRGFYILHIQTDESVSSVKIIKR